MIVSEIISEVMQAELSLNSTLAKWLQKKLPAITKRWWEELVLPSLTDMQRHNVPRDCYADMSKLDLASTVRVLLHNWFSLSGLVFLNKKYKYTAKNMLAVRNKWAHIIPSDVTKESVIKDLTVIKELLEGFDADGATVSKLENLILKIENDELVDAEVSTGPVVEQKIVTATSNTITVGSMVRLVADKNKTGFVTKVNGKKVYVFFGGSPQMFYQEQLELVEMQDDTKQISLDRLRTYLTAHQINNPGKSNLYSLNAARIDFVPYQFRPALKIIKSDEPRILIADDVGVGKTIEAGLILKELEARSEIKSVLVICPRALVVDHKWRNELQRFDEDFVELDTGMLRQIINNYDGAWPERYSKAIVSYSAFTDYMLNGDDFHSGLTKLSPAPKFDLVIVDEAHHIRNRETLGYKAVDTFIKNAEAVVFLTATPIQNSSEDLYTLLELLRSDIVNSKDTYKIMAEPNIYVNKMLSVVRKQEDGWQGQVRELYQAIMQTKYGYSVMQHNPRWNYINEAINKPEISLEEKVALISSIEELHTFAGIINRTRRRDIGSFCKRRTITVDTDFSPVQKQLYDAIIDFETKALTQLHGMTNVRFMMCTIMRQASSCLYGLAPFMEDFINRRIESLEQDGDFYDIDSELQTDNTDILTSLGNYISELIAKLPEEDPKFDKLYNDIIVPQLKGANGKVIVFSSFKHTLGYIRKKLEAKGIRVGQIDGSVPDEERRHISQRFKGNKDDDNTLDVLLFTEVGCEGLDYQFCDTLVNYDMPWNPMRIEQRIGRIDRRGQLSEAVKIFNLITEGTIDSTIYNRCLLKINIFENSIGDCAEILGKINKDISKIMYESGLTEEERAQKIEKMAENDILKINEMRKLENEEKSLFGFDLSSYILDKEVQSAENDWISADSMQKLVEMYLHDYLETEGGAKPQRNYLLGRNDVKSLQLSRENRRRLQENTLKIVPKNNTRALKSWENYLKGTNKSLSVTFNSEIAKDMDDVEFFNHLHPLVMQAAKYECKEMDYEIGLEICTDEYAKGYYPFLLYNWNYKGERDDAKLIPICQDKYVKENLLSMISIGKDYKFDSNDYCNAWDELDDLHYNEWSDAKAKFVEDVNAECEFRVEQKQQNLLAKKLRREEQYGHIQDVNIQNMNKGIYESIDAQIADIKDKYQKIAAAADINMELLVKGVVHIVNA